MDENHTMVAATSSAELLQAQADLWRHIFSYLKSVALSCAVKLGIPNAIHRCGGAASLPEILATIPVPANKQPYLPRLMRFLTALGILALDVPTAGEDAAGSAVIYCLTPVSRLLVDEAGADSCVSVSLSPFVLLQSMHFVVKGALRLGEWFGAEGEAPETPLKMEHGVDFWGILCHEPELNEIFNQGLGSDTRFVMHLAIRECGEVFEGISSLVDVGGGNGTAARAIAKAFPHVKCSVLDLPHVIGNIVPDPDGTVEFIIGDMMDFIPPADAVLLKYVLHDWTDEVCVKILTQCRKAIHSREAGGKVIIIDTVVGSPSGEMYEAQLLWDLLMMVVTAGKERDEHEWKKVFMDAGFSHYKVRPVLGLLSIIEVYP